MWLRKLYLMNEEKKITSIKTEYLSEIVRYMAIMKDDYVLVNSSREKITKTSILFDIEVMCDYKEQGIWKFDTLNGLAPEFIEFVKQYDISIDELRKAIEDGKYRSKRRFGYRYDRQTNNYILDRYTASE